MKNTVLINQKAAVDAGLIDATDLTDWAIIDFIKKFQLHPHSRFKDGHVWINLKNLVTEMPLLKLRSKQAISRRIQKLRDLGLISTIYDDNSKLYCKVTELCMKATDGDCNEEEEGLTGVDGGGQPRLTGGQPRVDIEPTNNNQPVVNQPEGGGDLIPAGLNVQAWDEYMAHRVACTFKPLKSNSIRKQQKFLVAQGDAAVQQAVVDKTIRNGWQGLFPLKGGGKQQPDQDDDFSAWVMSGEDGL